MFWVAITQIKRTLLRARRAQDIELQKTQGNRDQAQDNTENEASEKMNISDGQSADGSEKMGITDSLAANGNDKMNIIGGHAATGSEGMNIDDKNARQTDDWALILII